MMVAQTKRSALKKYFKRLYAKYLIKKGIIEAGNNSQVLKKELERITEQLRKATLLPIT